MSDTITFEVKNVEWSGILMGQKTASCLVDIPVSRIRDCKTDEDLARLVLQTLELKMGCLVGVCDSITVAA